MKKPLILIILDGWGIRKEKKGNATKLAKIPFFNDCIKRYPHSQLEAAGEAVGLPKGFQGNSEVGHLNIGAGRIVREQLVVINNAVKDKSFFKNKAFLGAIANCRRHNSTLHIMGLIQDEGVHAHQNHLVALLELAKKSQLEKVLVHAFSDGRDAPPKSAMRHISFVGQAMKRLNTGEFATVIGRYYAMDRDKRWERTKVAYDCLVFAEGEKVNTAEEAIRKSYSEKQTDEFIKPKIIGSFDGIQENDSIIFFNYRLDRARQLTHAFLDKKFYYFRRKHLKVHYVCMTEYYKGVPAAIAFPRQDMRNILGEVLSRNKKRQLRIAETEKYAHVTFFFNDEVEKPFKGEDRILIHSPKVATYDMQPEMSAYAITGKVVKAIEADVYDLIILNFANPDMVGHTGKMKAIVKALEHVDKCLERIVGKIVAKEGIAAITADHGNCEQKLGKTKTSHTTNKVNFILIGKEAKLSDGKLCDIAPTILELLKIPKPKEMTGKSLII